MPLRIFLTGCTGAVGSRLTLILLNYGYEVFGVSGSKPCQIVHPRHSCRKIDLLNAETFDMQKIQPNLLVHTSWLTTPGLFWESPENKKWLEASKQLIQEFIESGGTFTIVTGSCAEYFWEKEKPLCESSAESPSSVYGKAKLDLLNWIRENGIPFLWSRTFFQFGSDDPEGKLIPKAIKSFEEGNFFVVQNPYDTKDFVHVDDVAIILGILIKIKAHGVVNIGRGEGIEIKDLIDSLGSIFGRKDLIRYESEIGQSNYVVSDPTKLQSYIGAYEWKDLNHALEEQVNAKKAQS